MARLRMGKKLLDKSWKKKMPRGKKFKLWFIGSSILNIGLTVYILKIINIL